MNVAGQLKRIGQLVCHPGLIVPTFWIHYNRIMFRRRGVEFGSFLCVRNRIYIRKEKDSEIRIGDNFLFLSGACINPLSRNIRGCLATNAGAKLTIGNNVGISSASIWAHQQITIHDHVNIGANCIIMDSDAHSLNPMHRRDTNIDAQNKVNSPIEIGEDCLIGMNSIILKGVHIGARTVIGAGSVVTKDIPADCIAAGNPCKVIKYLNEQDQ